MFTPSCFQGYHILLSRVAQTCALRRRGKELEAQGFPEEECRPQSQVFTCTPVFTGGGPRVTDPARPGEEGPRPPEFIKVSPVYGWETTWRSYEEAE